jgi:L-ascorbate metabolism protein UlaG (beta-lactamase superfamily)
VGALLADGCVAMGPSQFERYAATLTSEAGVATGLRAQFFGVSTLLISDGETSIMVDGFFSRPSLNELVLLGTKPNENRISAALARGRVSHVDALLVAHSHFDHAMDAPTVARMTGAVLIGSESTKNIAFGEGFEKVDVINDGVVLEKGKFKISFFKSPHSRARLKFLEFPGAIDRPLATPARMWDYKSDLNYTFLLRHPDGNILIIPSANTGLGLSADVIADVVFLGIGNLSLRPKAFNEAGFIAEYWKEAVLATGCKLVIPIHWDSLTGSLDEPLELPPVWVDDVTYSMQELRQLADRDKVRLGIMPMFDAVPLP